MIRGFTRLLAQPNEELARFALTEKRFWPEHWLDPQVLIHPIAMPAPVAQAQADFIRPVTEIEVDTLPAPGDIHARESEPVHCVAVLIPVISAEHFVARTVELTFTTDQLADDPDRSFQLLATDLDRLDTRLLHDLAGAQLELDGEQIADVKVVDDEIRYADEVDRPEPGPVRYGVFRDRYLFEPSVADKHADVLRRQPPDGYATVDAALEAAKALIDADARDEVGLLSVRPLDSSPAATIRRRRVARSVTVQVTVGAPQADAPVIAHMATVYWVDARRHVVA